MKKLNNAKGCLFIVITAISFITVSCETGSGKKQGNQVTVDDEWEMLFDGTTLNGWKVNNQDFDNPDNIPEFYVADGMIVSKATNQKGGGYLVTEKSYDNFILELDVKIDTLLNSGIQCRGQIWESDTVTTYVAGNAEGTKRETEWNPGYLWGYQIEIDPSERAWSGGLYEPGNRGWIVTLADNEEARGAYKLHDWNHFKVVMDGNRIQTWVNDVPVVDTTDTMSSSGFIGLQYHGVYREEQKGMKSMWKNIRIKQL